MGNYKGKNYETKPKDAHISKLKLIKFWNQSIEPNKREIFPNSNNFKHFLPKTSYVRLIYPKLTEEA